MLKSRRGLASPILGVLLAALLAAACSGTPGTTAAPNASNPQVTQPPVTAPPVTAPPITAPPSIVADLPLEDLFPDEIGGHPLDVESAAGPSVLTMFNATDPAEFDDLLSQVGATIDQMSAALAFNFFPGASDGDFTGISILAFRLRGVPASATLPTLVALRQQDEPDSEVSQQTIGGKSVTAVVDPENPDNAAFLYAVGDVVFMVGGTPGLVEEAFAKLP